MDYVRFVLFCLFVTICDGEEDEVCCAPRFVDSMRECPDMDSHMFNGDVLLMGIESDPHGTGGLCLSGTLEILMDIVEGYEIELKVYRLLDLGKEYVYGAITSLCESLKSESAPWSEFAKTLNLTSCPIKKGIYPISKDVKINLDFAKDAMDHNFCGEYDVVLAVLDGVVEISCHVVSLEIFEKGNL